MNPESKAGVALKDSTTLEKPRFARDSRFSLGKGDHISTGIQEVKRSEERVSRSREGVRWEGLNVNVTIITPPKIDLTTESERQLKRGVSMMSSSSLFSFSFSSW